VQEKRLPKPRARRPRPNRIHELTKARKWTYPEVARRVGELARAKGDDERANTHTITINRLATGSASLTQEWMNTLAEVFGVSPAEIIAPPIGENLRRVTVVCALAAGAFRKAWQLPEHEQHDIMIPNAPGFEGLSLYAGEIRGDDNNRRYPRGALVVISSFKPGEINQPAALKQDSRYHVRTVRADGLIEDSIKCLQLGPEGQIWWLKPESDRPEFQEWLPITGKPGLHVEIVGRVRGVFLKED
jgi:transcriptional regulator with XRE-family HTH domain